MNANAIAAEPARSYSLHGLRLEVAGWEPATAAVDARLRRLAGGGESPGRPPAEAAAAEKPAGEAVPAAGNGALHFAFRRAATPPWEPPRNGRPVYDPPAGRVLFADAEDLLYIEIGESGEREASLRIDESRGRGESGEREASSRFDESRGSGENGAREPRLVALCRPGEGWAEIAVIAGRGSPGPADLYLLSHPLFTLPLCELAKRRGLFSLHAAGLCRDGRALLLPGQSGAGKSTLAVALARAGFGLLGDDTVFLARQPEGLRVLAFPDEIDLTEESAALLADPPGESASSTATQTWETREPRMAGPEPTGAETSWPQTAVRTVAGPLLTATRPVGARKLALTPESLAAGGLVAECAPGWLVFPRITGRDASELTPMSRDEALLALAPEVLPTEPCSSQAHLDALAELVAASEPWRLETGRDLAGAVALLAELTGRPTG